MPVKYRNEVSGFWWDLFAPSHLQVYELESLQCLCQLTLVLKPTLVSFCQKKNAAEDIPSVVRILGSRRDKSDGAASPSDLSAWTSYPGTWKLVWGWINYDSWNNYDRGKAAAESTVDNRGWFGLILSCRCMHLFVRLHENAVCKKSSVISGPLPPSPHPRKTVIACVWPFWNKLVEAELHTDSDSHVGRTCKISVEQKVFLVLKKLQTGSSLIPSSGWNRF